MPISCWPNKSERRHHKAASQIFYVIARSYPLEHPNRVLGQCRSETKREFRRLAS